MTRVFRRSSPSGDHERQDGVGELGEGVVLEARVGGESRGELQRYIREHLHSVVSVRELQALPDNQAEGAVLPRAVQRGPCTCGKQGPRVLL